MIEINLKKVVDSTNVLEILYGKKDEETPLTALLDFVTTKAHKLIDKLDKASKDDVEVNPISLKDDDCQKMNKLYKTLMNDALAVINTKCGTSLKIDNDRSKRYRHSVFDTLTVGKGYGWELPGLNTPSGVVNETDAITYRVNISGLGQIRINDKAEFKDALACEVMYLMVEIYAYACEVQSDTAITNISGISEIVFIDDEGCKYTQHKHKEPEIFKAVKSKISKGMTTKYGTFAKHDADSKYIANIQLYFVETVDGLFAFDLPYKSTISDWE